MIWVVMVVTIVIIFLGGIIGGLGILGGWHESQKKNSIVDRVIDWMF